MFILISALLVYTLIQFGAVQPHSLTSVILVSLFTFSVISLRQVLSGRFSFWVIVPFIAFIALVASGHFRLAFPVFMGAAAYMASVNSEPRTRLLFMRYLLTIGLLEAALGLVQYFITPGWIFGYRNLLNNSTGTLINPNHYAGLLEMIVPAAFALAYYSYRYEYNSAKAYLYMLGGAVLSLAVIFSLSRTGTVVLAITLIFLVSIIRLRESRPNVPAVLGLGMGALVAGGALWIGVDVLVQRYGLLTEQDALLREGRFVTYGNVLEMVAANPLGTGLGSFQDRFREYQTFRLDLLFDHAHNDYLQSAAEWGVPAAAAFWGLLFYLFWIGLKAVITTRSAETVCILLASLGAVFAMLLHSLTDFNLQIPSNSALFACFIGLICHEVLDSARQSTSQVFGS